MYFKKKLIFKYDKKLVICPNYSHFENKLRSVIVSQNHYLNQILDVHPLSIFHRKKHTENMDFFLEEDQQQPVHPQILQFPTLVIEGVIN